MGKLKLWKPANLNVPLLPPFVIPMKIRAVFTLLCLLCVCRAATWSYATLDFDSKNQTYTWTTQTARIENVSAKQLIQRLCPHNAEAQSEFVLGAIGMLEWEMVGVSNTPHGTQYVFKCKEAKSAESPVQASMPGCENNSISSRPHPSPVLERKARPALFAENKIGSANIGPAAVDARWSKYGIYLQKMLETVQMQWEKMIGEGKTYPPLGSIVTVKFIMDSNGAITKVVSVEGGMSGPKAEGYCVAAITASSSFGKWSDDMVAVLGQQQEMTFAFYYQ
jgi:hypothetical protein